MRNFKQEDKINSESAFIHTVKPLLIHHGWPKQHIDNMLPRIRFGRDYKNWSIRMEDRIIGDVPLIERTLRQPNVGNNKLILQAFIYRGEVLSYGVISEQLLAYVINNKINCVDNVNKQERVTFRSFRFDMGKKMFGNMCFVFNR